jgi:hypothetical protein
MARGKGHVIQIDMEAVYDVRAAACVLGRTPKTLHQWRSLGSGPPYHKVGGRVYYSGARLKSWLTCREYRSTSEEDAQ